MTDSVDQRDVGTCDSSTHAHDKVAISVKSGYAEEQVVELELGSRVTTILETVAVERDCDIEELILAREGEGEPLASNIVIDANYPHKRRHHVHHLGEIKVTVYYQMGQHTRTFKRFEAVKDVLSWAITVFDIDSSLATEFELVRHGQEEELPAPEHIGHLVGKNCELELDLVRGVIPNGSYP